MTTTPPPPRRIRTPPTPLHGPKYDEHDPYSTSPRRSVRFQQQHNQVESTQDRLHEASASASTPRSRKPLIAQQASSQTLSPPPSPDRPQAKTTSHHTLVGESSDAAHLTTDAAAMLPTPRKTPRKQHSKPTTTISTLNHGSHGDILPPQPVTRRQRLTLDSPEQSPQAIVVFTDSRDRIPVMDESEDNPFVGPRRIRSRASRRRRIQSAEENEMDAAAENGEGLVYMFRGRKILRRFKDPEAPENGEVDHAFSSQTSRIRQMVGPAARRPITPSDLEPRLLFPSNAPAVMVSEDEDEEQVTTDIDEHRKDCSEAETIPTAKIEALEVPAQVPTPNKGKRPSPFDSWPRQKPGARQVSQGVKRAAPEPSADSIGKRTRSHDTQV